MTEWDANELAAFKLCNEWCRAEALAIFAWDAASVRGVAVGPRPVASDPFTLQTRARAEVAG